MFSLIVTIIAIALVAALAAATLHYGGTAYSEGHVKARALTLINESSQIGASAKLYHAEQSQPAATLSDLQQKGYLANIGPLSSRWTSVDGYAFQTIPTAEECAAVNKLLKITEKPSCSDPAFSNVPVCCDS